MSTWYRYIFVPALMAGSVATNAQTPSPVLGNIEGPYNNIQSSVRVGGITWGSGVVAYGPVGTPLVLSGSNLGGGGTVLFVPYKNGVVDPNASSVQATVTLWTSSFLILTVPSGALTGLVSVTVEGQKSNSLPYMVTPGAYSGSCPAGPSHSQLQITTSALSDGAVRQSYSSTLLATGGTGAYTWSISSGTLPAGLALNTSTGTISGTPTSATGSNPSPITFQVSDTGSPEQTDEADISLTIQPQSMTSGTIYSYTTSYDEVGNRTQISDATYNNGPGIMGAWNMTAPGGGEGYDALNRLMAAQVTWPDGTQQYFCWSYDNFGNRLQQEVSSAVFQSGSGGAGSCNAQSSATVATDIASYNANNKITSTNAHGIMWSPGYDSAGNLQNDGHNYYFYDAEGRVCAVQNYTDGSATAWGYLYDAAGNRVAKGTVTPSPSPATQAISCDPTVNGFQFTENYVLGVDGEELSMLDGSGHWQRTNLYTGAKLIGTYDLVASQPALHFHLEDPLGTRKMQISGMLANLGQPETDFQSLPFGDQFASYPDPYADQNADDATPLHYTGKEHDSESDNDYFGARYYASSMGRWLSPDVINLTSARLMNPANTLNKYVYGANNPLKYIDKDGQDITVFYRPPSGADNDYGHIMLGVLNQATGKAAFLDYYPGPNGTDALGRGSGAYNLGDMSDRAAQNDAGQFASLTIRTTPEAAQKVIDVIQKLESSPAPDYSAILSACNCTTMVEDVLKDMGLDFGDKLPSSYWNDVYKNFAPGAYNHPFSTFFMGVPNTPGREYGNPRNYGMNFSQMLFQIYFNQMQNQPDNSSVTVTQTLCIKGQQGCN